MNEVWKDVKGLEGLYQVSNRGRVKSLPRLRANSRATYMTKERILKGNTSGHKYPRYNIDNKIVYLHHLVAEAFIGDRPEGLSVLHRDDNPLNNHIDNLYYGNQGENIEDAIKNGGFVVGEDSGFSKLTEKQVCNIYVSPLNKETLAKKYNVKYNTIWRIKTERTWRYLFISN